MSRLLGLTDVIFDTLGSLLYPLFATFFTVIDSVQQVFYSFAGINTVVVQGTRVENNGGFGDTDNGVIYYLFRSPTIKNIFFSMLILAVFLLVIFTIMAFIKNVYSAKQKKWQEIISNTIKGAISFVFIPVCCLLGAIAGNFLLQALNEATSLGAETTISRQLFIASSYEANRFRNDFDASDVAKLKKLYEEYKTKTKRYVISGEIEDNKDGEYYANILDSMYKDADFRSLWMQDVTDFYNLWQMSYLLLGAGGVFMLFALLKVTFGMIKRLFNLVLLYIVSPLICSMYPLDEGKAVGSWRGEFTKNFFSAYGAVVGMNIFYLLLPVFVSLNVEGFLGGLGIVTLIITISALYMVSEFVTLTGTFMSSITGGVADAYSIGSGLKDKVKGRLKQGTGKAGAAGKKVFGAFSRGVGAASERRREINEKASKDLGLKTRDDFATRAEWRAYKKDERGEYQANKDTLKAKQKAEAEKLGGGGLRAFGGSMASSAGHGALNILGNIADAAGAGLGFGKASNLAKDLKDTKGQGVENAKRQKATRDLMNDLTPADGNIDYAKVGKAFSGKYGEQIYESVKNTDAFKRLFEGVNIGEKPKSASDVGTFFSNLAKQQKAQTKLEGIQLNQQAWNDAIEGLVSDKDKNTTGWDKEQISRIISSGVALDVDKMKGTSNEKMANAINQLMREGIKIKDKEGKERTDVKAMGYNEAFHQGNLNIAAHNAYETAQTVRADLKDSSSMSQQLDNYLANIKEMLTKMDNGEEVREVNMNMESLKNVEEALFKELNKNFSDTMKSSSKDIEKAITKLADASKKDK